MKKAYSYVSLCISRYSYGGDEEDRTPDLRIANATLSQLSYVPINVFYNKSSEQIVTLYPGSGNKHIIADLGWIQGQAGMTNSWYLLT